MVRSIRYHLAAAVVLGATAWLTTVGIQEHAKGQIGTRAFGYGALVLLSITLMIGPLARLAPRSLSWLLAYRRATGIWSAASGVLHLIYALKLTSFYRLTWLTTFIKRAEVPTPEGTEVRHFLDFSDPITGFVQPIAWTGLLALVIMAGIALVSNDRTQRWLGHPAWKLIQQQAYLAFGFVSLHVLLMRFGHKLKGSPMLLSWAPWLLLTVAALQAAGFCYTVWKQRTARSGRPPKDISA